MTVIRFRRSSISADYPVVLDMLIDLLLTSTYIAVDDLSERALSTLACLPLNFSNHS